jgi:hypothetical protein
MTERVIQADYVNWRTVVGRKSLQLIFEIDISLQGEVLEMLGPPRTDVSVPCAIALLDMKKVKAEGQAEQSEAAPPKKPWSEYSRSQQAAILCSNPDFWRYFATDDEDDTVRCLKKQLRIVSRKELDSDPEAGKRFDELVALYNLHDRQRYAGSKR